MKFHLILVDDVQLEDKAKFCTGVNFALYKSYCFPLGRGKRERNSLTGISCFDLRECEETVSSNKYRFY